MVSDNPIVDTNAMELHEYAGTWGTGTLVPRQLRILLIPDMSRLDGMRAQASSILKGSKSHRRLKEPE
jgi:hypothetical protein